MTAFNNSMFQSIKAALSKDEKKTGSSLYTEIMKTEVGKTYTVRLLPYAKDPSKTFFHYYNHGWNSFATGQYVQALSPQTFNERDPISEERFKVLRGSNEEEKQRWSKVIRSEKWLVNVYVVEDPTNPDNNGQVKILRYGKQLQKIIIEAIEGEDAEEFGARIFDLGPDGVSLKIKVEKQGDYPSYVSSRFTSGGKLSLSKSDQEAIYNKTFNLEEVFPVKTYDELKQMIKEHIYANVEESEAATESVRVLQQPKPVQHTQPAAKSKPQDDDITDDIPFTTEDSDELDDIDELLKDL